MKLVGAEVCQLVGTFVLATLSKKIPSSDIGLYRNDDLGALWNMPGPQAAWIRKDVIRIFEELELRITIQINLKVADFLDVTLNLNSESIPNAKLPSGLYPLPIQPPPNIIKNLPASISRRLTNISSDETAFGNAKPMY